MRVAAPWPWAAAWAGAILSCAAGLASAAPCAVESGAHGGAHGGVAVRAMVVAAHPDAAGAGCRVLARGGNAMDAAVAVQMVLAVVEPQASGPGGGSVLLHFDAASGRVRMFDGIASAPVAVNADLRAPLDAADARRCARERLPAAVTVSARAVAVPGTVALLALAHRELGQLPWRELFDDAIASARDGFALPPYLAAVLAEPVQGIARCAWPDLRARYCADARTPLPPGSRIVNPHAAVTLQRIRDAGLQGFVGAMAESVATRITAQDCALHGRPPTVPGVLRASDVVQYRAVEREPLCRVALGHRVCTAPAPSYGGLVLLRILDFMDRAGEADLSPDSAAYAHRFLHASQHAQADRRRIVGDPDRAPEHGAIDLDAALAPAVLRAVHAAFAPQRAAALPETGADDAPEQHDQTTHVSIIDAAGNAVSMTSTNNKSFGAHLEAGGFVLNNGLANFTSPRARGAGARVNAMAPGARARTAMTPALVFDADGALRVVAGAAGGAAIPDFVARAVLGVIAHGMTVRQAVAQGHLSGQRLDTAATRVRAAADLERGSNLEAHRAALEALGYAPVSVRRLRSGLALVHVHQDGTLHGAADPRRDGVAAGF